MKRRGSFTFGFILILLGAWFLAIQFVPDIGTWMEQIADWPIWIIGPGVVFILAGLISGVTELMIPGSIISGIGLILYYQNTTGDWESWSYAWALIPMFVGVGIFLSYLFKGKVGKAFEEGGPPFISGIVMFLIFGSIFRGMLGQSPMLGDYWPVALMVVGLWLLVKPFFRRREKAAAEVTINIETDDKGEVFVKEPKSVEEIENWELELDQALDAEPEEPEEANPGEEDK